MSLETRRSLVLSEWRTVLVSQTSYPTMYTVERPQRIREESKLFTNGSAFIEVPIGGSRTITKWQEQVRSIGGNDHQWYVVRQWSEVDM